jgi:cell wall-associated NlpC family hydrolase
MGVAVPGLFCTVALPAYAYTGPENTDEAATAALSVQKEDNAQAMVVPEGLTVTAASRDEFGATSAAEMRRVAMAVSYASYGGPTVRDFLANPPYPNFSLDAVVSVALQYIGVPYRFGGSDPSGFDCSGFTMFVYAQFGVALPHSASRQNYGGVAIAPSAALPGDLVFMDGNGHVGIYLGNGMMIDAPKPGTTVQVRAIYSSSAWFVRYGI